MVLYDPRNEQILCTSLALGPIWPSSLLITGNAPWSPLLTLCQSKVRTRICRHYTEAAAAREIRAKTEQQKYWIKARGHWRHRTARCNLGASAQGGAGRLMSAPHQNHLQNMLVSSTHTSTHTSTRAHMHARICESGPQTFSVQHWKDTPFPSPSGRAQGRHKALREPIRAPRWQSRSHVRGLQHRLRNDFYLLFTMEIGY